MTSYSLRVSDDPGKDDLEMFLPCVEFARSLSVVGHMAPECLVVGDDCVGDELLDRFSIRRQHSLAIKDFVEIHSKKGGMRVRG